MTGTVSSNELLFRRGQSYFYAFDLLWSNGKDLRSLTLIERKQHLKRIVAKHGASPYSASAKWIKIKNPTYTQTERRDELFESFNCARRVVSSRRVETERDVIARSSKVRKT